MKLMILDGNSILNRAFYGVRDLTTRDGLHTNAVYGFLNILHRVENASQPDALCVAFDLKGPTFRHELSSAYKATRKGMPEELAQQLSPTREVLAALQIPVFTCQGFEADDILGTAARLCAEEGWDCEIVTGDRDSLQLVDDRTTVRLLLTRTGRTDDLCYTPAVFREEYGFEPPVLVDLKALMGDSSDNIPGVPGIGQKTAMDLLHRFGTLAGVYDHIGDPSVRPAVRKKLEEGKSSADLSYTLATIRRDAPIVLRPEDCLRADPDRPALRAIFRTLEFTRLFSRYGLDGPDPEELPVEDLSRAPGSDPQPLSVLLPASAEALPRSFTAPDAGPLTCLLSADGGMLAAIAAGEGILCCCSLLGEEAYRGVLAVLLESDRPKQTLDLKTLIARLLPMGIRPRGFKEDAALAAYLLDPTAGDYSASALTARFLTQVLPTPELPGGELPSGAETLLSDCIAAEALSRLLPARLEEQGMTELYRQLELPLCAVLAAMEDRGVAVDSAALEAFGKELTLSADRCAEHIYALAGRTFNIQSPKQLGEVLFTEMSLPHGKKTKTGWSTSAEVLEPLRDQYEIVDEVLNYRTLTKLSATYAEGLRSAIGSDGRIHTTFRNLVTATGRLSSTDPNLQNIPVRTELGSEFRRMFIAPPGFVLVDADYSQIELRVLACVADDPAMQEAFRSGEDFHTHTAAKIFHTDPQEVTPELRRRAKAVNFGIVYGISEFSLAKDLSVSRWEARDIIEEYLTRFPGVRAYMTEIVEQGRALGYVSTLRGRRRPVRDLTASNRNLRAAAERIALNAPIQGTAADIMKAAMLRVERALAKDHPSARMLLQIHDELIVECPQEEAETVCALLTREMAAAAAGLPVPMPAEAGFGHSWAEAK